MMFRNEDRWDEFVNLAATATGVQPALIKAVIGNETAFRWVGDAHPVTGRLITTSADLDREEPKIGDASVGVMQILTKTASAVMGKPVPRELLRDPQYNIQVGARYLRDLFAHGFSIPEVLAGYNGGPGMVSRQRRTGGPFGNQAYVDRAMRSYQYFAGSPLSAGGTLTPESGAGLVLLIVAGAGALWALLSGLRMGLRT